MLHLADAWARRDDGNVVLVHYDDLRQDLDGSMRRLSRRLGIAVDEERLHTLVRAAGFEVMRANAQRSVPDTLGVFKDNVAFFRLGASGEGPALVGEEGMARYRARVEGLAPPDLLAWLHRDEAARQPHVDRSRSWSMTDGNRSGPTTTSCPTTRTGLGCSSARAQSAGSTRRRFLPPRWRPSSVPTLRRGLACSRPLPASDAAQLRRRPRPDRWAPIEYACHVRDVFVLYLERLRLMLEEDNPLYPNWDQDATAVQGRYADQDIGLVSAQLLRAAASLAAAFESVRGDEWQRQGRRSDGASFTVDSFSRYMVHDPVHHLFDVTGERVERPSSTSKLPVPGT